MPLFCNDQDQQQQQQNYDHYYKDESSYFHHHLRSTSSNFSKHSRSSKDTLRTVNKIYTTTNTTLKRSFTNTTKIVETRKLLKKNDEIYTGTKSLQFSPSPLSPLSPSKLLFSPPSEPLFVTLIFHRLLLIRNFFVINYFTHYRQQTPTFFLNNHKLLFYYNHYHTFLSKIFSLFCLILFTFSIFCPIVLATPDPQKTSGKLIAGSSNGPHSASDIKIGKWTFFKFLIL